MSPKDATVGGVHLPIARPGESGWEYTTVRPWRVRLRGVFPDFECKWFSICGGVLTVFSRYSWDGSTGVCEGGDDEVSGLPKTCIASGVHDIGYQFRRELALAWGWRQVAVLRLFDNEFWFLMRAWGVPAWRYNVRWAGVRVLGRPFTLAAALVRRVRGIEDECARCGGVCRGEDGEWEYPRE